MARIALVPSGHRPERAFLSTFPRIYLFLITFFCSSYFKIVIQNCRSSLSQVQTRAQPCPPAQDGRRTELKAALEA